MTAHEWSGASPVHASAVAFGAERGVLILGASGSGKSSLALALIDRGAALVADDRTILIPSRGALHARAPRRIAGLIEARGLGILSLPHLPLARIRLVIDCDAPEPTRLPEPRQRAVSGIFLPCLANSRHPSFATAVSHYLAGRAYAAGRHDD